MNPSERLRIGVLDLTNAGWMGGLSYTHMIVQSLSQAARDEDVEVCAFTIGDNRLPDGVRGVEALPVESSGYALPGRALRRFVPLPDRSNLFWLAKKRGLTVVVPALGLPKFTFGTRSIGWIPDFQHVHLPQFFSAAERAGRDRQFADVAARCNAVILSSQDAYRDFHKFAPHAIDKAKVLPFPSIFAFSPPSGNVSAAVTKYHLPEKFALVVNQFWAHKNHAVVVKALSRLRDQGVRIPVVMTGLPNDPRDLQNSTLSALLQQIAIERLQDQILILGRVPYSDLVSLERSTALLIQPSRFEGWNTSVQDLKALGKPMVCSDLAVHHEQASDCLGFFGCDDASALADLLANVWPGLPAGPDATAEKRAIAEEQAFARSHGAKLLEICREVAGAASQ
jgi:glycosyltransferase involved in cell wall biosynthesis